MVIIEKTAVQTHRRRLLADGDTYAWKSYALKYSYDDEHFDNPVESGI